MIARSHINAWRTTAPWQDNEQVEQDLIICRSLVEIFSDEVLSKNLAFRGGTALHKLHTTAQTRYSEDIDLVQIKAEPIGNIIDCLRDKLSFLGTPKINQKSFNNTIVFKYESEIAPVRTMKLKVEINCREHFSVYGYKKLPFSVSSEWFKGKCDITTFELDDLLGTKVRALYQRKKGRDLFDLFYVLTETKANPKRIAHAFHKYMEHEGHKVSQREFILNMEKKMKEVEFTNDMKNLLRPEVNFDMGKAWDLVRKDLIELL
ncbi:MAG: nucleotidyl transferase AbiEii/AbiGii toxin family protein [Bacteroidetes bacterium]|nr:MAG: nucleotidyl transferase AbiEii/AbiGii toxin family protein [Bacteroidota bacterium]